MVFEDFVTALDVLSVHNPNPAQRPQFDVCTRSKAGRSKNLVSTLKGKAKPFETAGGTKV